MKYDVFISYSREDKAVADSLCHALDKAGISYWIDRNIHGSANFLSEITQYIRRCKVVVFIASSHSASAEWTQKEILFANKHHKTIVPYRIGDFRFDDNDELDFVFINVQWIESEAEVIEALQKLGCEDQGRKEKEALLAQLREECQALKKAEDIARTEFEKVRLLYSQAEKQRKEKEREKLALEALKEAYKVKEEEFGAETMRKIEREVYLKVLDTLWMQHLENMQHLREGIHWRSVGQRDPLVEYRSESQKLFDGLQRNLREEVLKILLSITPAEARAEDVTDGEEYESELTKMAEGQTEKGVNEISRGDKNLDDEFRSGRSSIRKTTARKVVKKSGSKKKKSASKKKSNRKRK